LQIVASADVPQQHLPSIQETEKEEKRGSKRIRERREFNWGSSKLKEKDVREVLTG
jgi:hypothetical protein